VQEGSDDEAIVSRTKKKTSAACLLVLVASVAACERHSASPLAVAATAAHSSVSVQDRIAHELLEASPLADPADAKARDEAAERLTAAQDLLGAFGERVLWGGFDPQKRYDPKANTVTELSPIVWAKVYLSTFEFPGPYEVRREGPYTVLEIAASFRDGLDSGDYPYPFWHSAKKWHAYVNTRALLLVFEHDRLLAAYRRPAPDSEGAAARNWDSRWRWTDAEGHERPRVALFTYLLSPDNPWLTRLDRAYRDLEVEFRGNNCVSCHSPDNPAKASPLLLLDFPNQALVARHTLVETLRGNKMPPADPKAHKEAGVADSAVREQLIVLAEEFRRDADAALAFERTHPPATSPVSEAQPK
jgi:hypothetical protein